MDSGFGPKNDPKTSPNMEAKDETPSTAVQRKNLVLDFLHKELNKSQLRKYENWVEIHTKSSFYIEILPTNKSEDKENSSWPENIFQLVDPRRFQRVKDKGVSKTKTQLFLLQEYLNQLQKGQEDLFKMVQSDDKATGRCLEMTDLLDKFRSMLVPGKLYKKNLLTSGLEDIRIPRLRLVLKARPPVIFDRRACVAHGDWVSLKWSTLGEKMENENYDLCYNICTTVPTAETSSQRGISVSSDRCEIHNLLPDQIYDFSVRRSETDMLVYEVWNDMMTLKTKKPESPLDNKSNPQEPRNSPSTSQCYRSSRAQDEISYNDMTPMRKRPKPMECTEDRRHEEQRCDPPSPKRYKYSKEHKEK
ncbi:fibronectin type III domain-containing protein 11 [Leptodactylus fuscus]|uniref:fibronectin type III domain-containing protein 11 n=1 Tax=Leptodactylus fuscus TaxID=238119 RepID=UPI003F4E4F0E